MILYVVCSTFCNASSSWMLMWYCEHFYATPRSKKNNSFQVQRHEPNFRNYRCAFQFPIKHDTL